ncbi:MAG: hypothetical protein ACR2MA_09465 [Egibacteraceae bacterium]
MTLEVAAVVVTGSGLAWALGAGSGGQLGLAAVGACTATTVARDGRRGQIHAAHLGLVVALAWGLGWSLAQPLDHGRRAALRCGRGRVADTRWSSPGPEIAVGGVAVVSAITASVATFGRGARSPRAPRSARAGGGPAVGPARLAALDLAGLRVAQDLASNGLVAVCAYVLAACGR